MIDLLLQVAPPSNTWFTESPEWGWYIVVYFFLGGIAGGAAFLSGMLDLLGDRLDRRMTRIDYLLALVAISIGGPLLVLDLTLPERFWHMIWKSDTGGPMFKYYSAISLGVWIILAFVLRSEEHTSELQSQSNLVCRLLLEKKKHQRPLSLQLMY